jgi:hypothetical protein
MAAIGYNSTIIWTKGRGLGNHLNIKAVREENASVINVSYLNGDTSTARNPIELAIEKEILDRGVIVIRGAGNGFQDDSLYAHKPLIPFDGITDLRTIVVSSTDKYDYFDPIHDTSWVVHSHYSGVDLCAPGHNIMAAKATLDTTGNPIAWPYYSPSGTSFAAPLVSGTAALMKSVNPCLNSNWAQDLLKNTTDPIKDAAQFKGEIGTGRLNAHKAVAAAQGAYSLEEDLYIKDRPEDFGYPGSYAWGWWFDKSPDIWVRNSNDGFTVQEHQEPHFSAGEPVYVYVRVWNKSCDSTLNAANLSLYWSKASSSSSWPQNWDGSQPTTGDVISSQAIPSLAPGESKIFEFEWLILNPHIHANWATCLLARIESEAHDTITVYPNHLENDVYNNNNVAMRNVTVIDINPGAWLPVVNNTEYPHGRFMYIGNGTDIVNDYNITFSVPLAPNAVAITNEAEVHIYTNDNGWDILGAAVAAHPEIDIIEDKHFVLTSPTISLENLNFLAHERVPIYVGFSFLVDEITNEQTYEYTVSQRFSAGEQDLTGAEHFIINKSPRSLFDADAGYDQQIRKNDSTQIDATDIAELAIYNWYSPEGELLYTGKNTTVSPTISSTYKLEVIAGNDGFKDYDEVEIEVQEFWIDAISPNPTQGMTSINYHIEGAGSAYLMLINSTGTSTSNYILTLQSSQSIIDFGSLATGSYTLVLVVDGLAVDSRNLVIQ